MSDTTKQVQYEALRSFGTKGSVSGRNGYFTKGQTFTAPEGEFHHLGDTFVRVVESAPSEGGGSEGGDQLPEGYSLNHAGGGYYEIKRGDEVLEKVQGKKAAQARAAELAAD